MHNQALASVPQVNQKKRRKPSIKDKPKKLQGQTRVTHLSNQAFPGADGSVQCLPTGSLQGTSNTDQSCVDPDFTFSQSGSQLSPSVEQMVSEAWELENTIEDGNKQQPVQEQQQQQQQRTNPEVELMDIQLQSLLSGANVGATGDTFNQHGIDEMQSSMTPGSSVPPSPYDNLQSMQNNANQPSRPGSVRPHGMQPGFSHGGNMVDGMFVDQQQNPNQQISVMNSGNGNVMQVPSNHFNQQPQHLNNNSKLISDGPNACHLAFFFLLTRIKK